MRPENEIKIKICGLTRPEDAEAVNIVLPDYIGFVFWEKSRRNVSRDKAEMLSASLDGRIRRVGVFVDEDADLIYELLKDGIIDMAQLHGSEDEEYIKRLKSMGEFPVIKAFNINRVKDFEEIEKSPADHVMIDPGKGDGKTFEWGKLNGLKRPFFLAGGLDPENVGNAIELLKPFAVDVSSGVETDGLKDKDKIIRFAQACRHGNPGVIL